MFLNDYFFRFIFVILLILLSFKNVGGVALLDVLEYICNLLDLFEAIVLTKPEDITDGLEAIYSLLFLIFV